MKNIIRYLIPISEKANKPLMEITRKYVEYISEEPLGELPDVLEFNKDAYEKTKQFYNP